MSKHIGIVKNKARRTLRDCSEHLSVFAINLALLAVAVVALAAASIQLGWNGGNMVFNVLCGIVPACVLATLLETAAMRRKRKELVKLRRLCFGDLEERISELLSQVAFLTRRVEDDLFDWQLVNAFASESLCGLVILQHKDERDVALRGRKVRAFFDSQSLLYDCTHGKESPRCVRVREMFSAIAAKNAAGILGMVDSINNNRLQITAYGLATKEELDSLCMEVSGAIDLMYKTAGVNYLAALHLLLAGYEWLCDLLGEPGEVKGEFPVRGSIGEPYRVE